MQTEIHCGRQESAGRMMMKQWQCKFFPGIIISCRDSREVLVQAIMIYMLHASMETVTHSGQERTEITPQIIQFQIPAMQRKRLKEDLCWRPQLSIVHFPLRIFTS